MAQKGTNNLQKRGFDVVVFVATSGEMDAIIRYTKAINQSQWMIEHDNNDEIIRTLLVKNQEGRVLRLALQALPIMGAEACVYYVSHFLSEHPCIFVSMVGICAGEEEKTKKGDLVIPGTVASITNGKEGEREDKSRDFRPANRLHSIGESLRKKLASFKALHWGTVQKEMMGKWNSADPAWQEQAGYREPELHFEEKLVMAQVANVRAYTNPFGDLKEASREVVALEMESAALAYVVEKMHSKDGRWLVIKGVQDYADGLKDHKFRPFCSWSSFFTLIKFLELESLDCWANKVRIKKDIERIEAKETANELRQAYRSGEFYKAVSIGNRIFNARPNDSSIWRIYLLSLMRMQEYEKAADMISIADYYIQMEAVKGKDALDYLVGKSDYYLRIGSFKDSATYIDEIISQCEGESALKEQTAQAHYMKGRIFLSRYQQDHEATLLDDAMDQFAVAVNLSPEKYWASILLLFTKYLKTGDDPLEIEKTERLETVLADHIKENEWRPAPRIYRLRLHALRVAVGKITFKQLQAVINEEVKHCRRRLLLPNDFFLDFENDCRLLFPDEKDRHKQDRLLSLVYRWASEVRRRT